VCVRGAGVQLSPVSFRLAVASAARRLCYSIAKGITVAHHEIMLHIKNITICFFYRLMDVYKYAG